MRQSRTRKKVPRGAVLMPGPSGISTVTGHGEQCDPNIYNSQATIVQRTGDVGGCVDCHDFYEIHV